MSIANDLAVAANQPNQVDEWDEIEIPPTDLWSDEPPLESDLHLRQIILLLQALESLWHDRQDFYAAGNLTIYYSPEHIKSRDFKGPDFFVVLNTERRPRKSWVVWGEGGQYPNLIVEILSDSTAAIDRGAKKQVYQDIFRTPEYFWFDPETLEFAGFLLVGGSYQPIESNASGHLWSQQLGLHLGIYNNKLRYFSQGELVLTPEEAAIQERQRAETERRRAESEYQRAETERQRADRLAAKLRELGIDPAEID